MGQEAARLQRRKNALRATGLALAGAGVAVAMLTPFAMDEITAEDSRYTGLFIGGSGAFCLWGAARTRAWNRSRSEVAARYGREEVEALIAAISPASSPPPPPEPPATEPAAPAEDPDWDADPVEDLGEGPPAP